MEVKENAKCGVTKVNGYEYNIECEDKSNNIVEEENKNDDIIENNNNQENNVTDKVILDDTKFYVLAGLLGTVVIEMFVLILKKTKKA